MCMICPKCNKRKRKVTKSRGKEYVRATCNPCSQSAESLAAQRRRGAIKRHPYRHVKKSFCEKCGFVAEDVCQLDVDHIDGNHQNNDPENLQTLCANCHRLKTKLSKEGLYRVLDNPLTK